jgi:TPR repeat protein
LKNNPAKGLERRHKAHEKGGNEMARSAMPVIAHYGEGRGEFDVAREWYRKAVERGKIAGLINHVRLLLDPKYRETDPKYRVGIGGRFAWRRGHVSSVTKMGLPNSRMCRRISRLEFCIFRTIPESHGRGLGPGRPRQRVQLNATRKRSLVMTDG